MAKDPDTKKGVEAAWDFWLSQHDVSVPEIIKEAVKEAFGAWLNAHTDEILERVHAAMPAIDLDPEEDQQDSEK